MKSRPGGSSEPRDLGREWHSDSLFETCPSDFSFLRMQATPPAGGDTLWVSGYELYDRLSPPFQRFLESLTAECAQPVFKSACDAGGYEVMSPRGSPLNVDFKFAPHHPVIRTHPVTGWKSLFAGVGLHVSKIDGVWAYEDQMIREYLMRILTRSHDCVARMHWTKGACAIWSNACTLHAATVSPSSLLTSLCRWKEPDKSTAGYAPGRRSETGCPSFWYWRSAVYRPSERRQKRGVGLASLLRACQRLRILREVCLLARQQRMTLSWR